MKSPSNPQKTYWNAVIIAQIQMLILRRKHFLQILYDLLGLTRSFRITYCNFHILQFTEMRPPPNESLLQGEQEYILFIISVPSKDLVQQLSAFGFQGVIFAFLANHSRLYNLPQLPHTLVYARRFYYRERDSTQAVVLAEEIVTTLPPVRSDKISSRDTFYTKNALILG